MPAPVFGPDQIDPAVAGNNGYDPGTSVRLGTNMQADPYWSNWFLQGAQSPQGAFSNPYQTANQDQARAQQQQVIQDLQRQATGDPNSRAQQQLRQGYGAAQAQQASLGSTMRGQSAGAAMRGVQAGQQGIQRGLAGDQQMLQLQEQQAAQQMLAQMLAQQQGQDIAQAQGMAQGALGAQGLNDAMQQFYMQGGIQAALGANQFSQDQARAQLGFDLESQNLRDQFNQGLVGMGQGAAGTALSMWGPKSSGSGYRQVGGQDSIVPEYDK